jgi:hypothetical protein
MRSRPPVSLAIGIAVIVSALAAAASAYLSLLDADELYYCGCDAEFRLAEAWCQVPPVLVALLGMLHLVAPPARARSLSRRLGCAAVYLLALLEIAFVLLVAGMTAAPGPAHAAVLGSHLLLLMLLVISRLLR